MTLALSPFYKGRNFLERLHTSTSICNLIRCLSSTLVLKVSSDCAQLFILRISYSGIHLLVWRVSCGVAINIVLISTQQILLEVVLEVTLEVILEVVLEVVFCMIGLSDQYTSLKDLHVMFHITTKKSLFVATPFFMFIH